MKSTLLIAALFLSHPALAEEIDVGDAIQQKTAMPRLEKLDKETLWKEILPKEAAELSAAKAKLEKIYDRDGVIKTWAERFGTKPYRMVGQDPFGWINEKTHRQHLGYADEVIAKIEQKLADARKNGEIVKVDALESELKMWRSERAIADFAVGTSRESMYTEADRAEKAFKNQKVELLAKDYPANSIAGRYKAAVYGKGFLGFGLYSIAPVAMGLGAASLGKGVIDSSAVSPKRAPAGVFEADPETEAARNAVSVK